MSNSTQNIKEWAGDPMYPKNTTQNKVFNDLPEKDQKEIIRGAMKHAKRKQDEILDSKKQISNEVDVATGGKDIRIEDSTQNDEIKQMERAINEGFAESEKFLKGMKTPFDKSSTQNDWEELLSKSLKSMKLGMSGSQAEWIFEFVREQRADARREVIDEIKNSRAMVTTPPPDLYDSQLDTTFQRGVDSAYETVLATLRKEKSL